MTEMLNQDSRPDSGQGPLDPQAGTDRHHALLGDLADSCPRKTGPGRHSSQPNTKIPDRVKLRNVALILQRQLRDSYKCHAEREGRSPRG
jgi:hypothetical protein